MSLSASDVVGVLGPVDETLIAKLVATGASQEELAEAWAWINNDEALMGEGRHLPSGKVAELADLIASEDLEAEGP
jgi:hypothetical protein